MCTTDADHNQIGSFYTGAMSEARQIELKTVADRVGGLDLVLIGADDPEAMLRHTEECRTRGIPFAADFSQQIARMDGDDIRILLEGADVPLLQRVREGPHRVQDRLDATRRSSPRSATGSPPSAPRGVRIERAGEEPDRGRLRRRRSARPTPPASATPSAPGSSPAWPGASRLERAAQVGCMLATLVIETVGTQEYQLRRAHFMDRFTKAYGDDAAAEVRDAPGLTRRPDRPQERAGGPR